jgi:hypothetical protein
MMKPIFRGLSKNATKKPIMRTGLLDYDANNPGQNLRFWNRNEEISQALHHSF